MLCRNRTGAVLKAAQDVGEALRAAKISQDAARAAINNATVDIMEAGKDLTTTSDGTDSAEVTAASSLEAALLLQQRLRAYSQLSQATLSRVQRRSRVTSHVKVRVRTTYTSYNQLKPRNQATSTTPLFT